jgi:phage baseplate assembly protein W
MPIFSDIDLNFRPNPVTGDVFVNYDEKAVKASVKNLILTNHYERPFHSEIGSPIRNLLFENYSPMLILNIKKSIEQLIGMYEPRVQLLDVSVEPSVDESTVSIGIFFRIKNTTSQLSVVVTIERTR